MKKAFYFSVLFITAAIMSPLHSAEKKYSDAFESAQKKMSAGDTAGAYAESEGALGLSRTASEKSAVYFLKGQIAESELDYSVAVEFYRTAGSFANLTPHQRTDALWRLAEVCIRLRDYSAAREIYQKTISDTGLSEAIRIGAFMNMARSYELQGDWENLLKTCTLILEKQNIPLAFQSTLLAMSGNALAEMRKFEPARAEYAKAAALKDIPASDKLNSLFASAKTYEMQNNPAAAREIYSKIAADPAASTKMKIKAFIASGDTYFNMREYDQARSEYNKAYSVKDIEFPERLLSLKLLASTFEAQGNLKTAKEHYRRIPSDWRATASEKAEGYQELASFLIRINDLQEAAAAYSAILALPMASHAEKAAAIFGRAEVMKLEGQYYAARIEYQQIMDAPGYPQEQKRQARKLLASAYASDPSVESYVANMTSAAKIYTELYESPGFTMTERTEILFAVPDAYRSKSDYANARFGYEKITSDPELTPRRKIRALSSIADTYFREKDYARAHSEYAKILTLPGITELNMVNVVFAVAEIYQAQEKWKETIGEYARILAMRNPPESIVIKALCGTASCQANLKELDGMKSTLEKLLAHNDALTDAAVLLDKYAALSSESGDTHETAWALETIFSFPPFLAGNAYESASMQNIGLLVKLGSRQLLEKACIKAVPDKFLSVRSRCFANLAAVGARNMENQKPIMHDSLAAVFRQYPENTFPQEDKNRMLVELAALFSVKYPVISAQYTSFADKIAAPVPTDKK